MDNELFEETLLNCIEYKHNYIKDNGKEPYCIFLSKRRIIELEKGYNTDKILKIFGMKVLSHTYDKYGR